MSLTNQEQFQQIQARYDRMDAILERSAQNIELNTAQLTKVAEQSASNTVQLTKLIEQSALNMGQIGRLTEQMAMADNKLDKLKELVEEQAQTARIQAENVSRLITMLERKG